MRFPLRVWVAVTAIAAAIAHSRDYWFGVVNQPTYFLEPLRQAHPELYRHDWLVSGTAMYHSVFGKLAALLFQIDDSGVYSVGIAHFVVMTAVVVALFVVIAAVTEHRALAVFAIIAGWLAIGGDRSIAGSYLWAGYLQPSLLATLGWIIAIAAYVRGRPLATGVALALGGLFHANFLLLGIGAFALAELVLERGQRRERVKRLIMLLAPQLVALALLAPDILASTHDSEPTLALWVLSRFHAPIHYDPFAISTELVGFARWPALALVVAPIAAAWARRDAIRRLNALAVIIATICIATCLIALVPPLERVTRLYVWRMAPFAALAAQIVVLCAAVATLEDPARWRALPRWRLGAAVALGGWIAWTETVQHLYPCGWVWWIALGAIGGALVVPVRWRAALPAIVAVSCLGVAIGESASVIVAPHFEESGDPPAIELFAWVRGHTPVDAEFLVPPDAGTFRLLARRAIYVDFKSPPLVPDELVEWYRRLGRVVAFEHPVSIPDVRARWDKLSAAERLDRGRELGVQYVVMDRGAAHASLPIEPVFHNAGYAVYPTGVALP